VIITPLKDLHVWIARPLHQAKTLSESIQMLGGKTVLLPTITIADMEDQQLIEQVVYELSKFDIAIFVSPNAVEKTVPFIQEVWPETTQLVAVGSGTANALQKFDLPISIYPQKNFNSEGLLALPVFQSVLQKQIIVFKGEGGRELLANTLRERGAFVTEIPVYRRMMPEPLQHFPSDVDVIICTSNTGLHNLYQMVQYPDRVLLLSKQLLVVSERIATEALQLGFVKNPWVADNATDAAIIAKLIRVTGEKDGRVK
jgi:uroporphyrinogen-III synthase